MKNVAHPACYVLYFSYCFLIPFYPFVEMYMLQIVMCFGGSLPWHFTIQFVLNAASWNLIIYEALTFFLHLLESMFSFLLLYKAMISCKEEFFSFCYLVILAGLFAWWASTLQTSIMAYFTNNRLACASTEVNANFHYLDKYVLNSHFGKWVLY